MQAASTISGRLTEQACHDAITAGNRSRMNELMNAQREGIGTLTQARRLRDIATSAVLAVHLAPGERNV